MPTASHEGRIGATVDDLSVDRTNPKGVPGMSVCMGIPQKYVICYFAIL